MRVSPAGQWPAHTSSTEPAGSREGPKGQLHPAEVRRRTTQLVNQTRELGQPMHRGVAHGLVVAYAERVDVSADGWNKWLACRFDPVPAAALANIKRERGGRDA